MRVLLAAVAAMTLAQPVALDAQQSPLNASYTAKVGDFAAISLSELLKLRTELRNAAIVSFEPTTGTIDVEVYSSATTRVSTDNARATLGEYWALIEAAHIPYVDKRFKAKLTSAQYRLIYYVIDAQGGARVVIQFVNGQYVVP